MVGVTAGGRMVRGVFRPWQPPAPGRYCLNTCYCGECAHYRAPLTVTRPTKPAKPVRLLDKDVWLVHYINWVRALPVGREYTTADAHGKIPDPNHTNWWGLAQTRVAKLGLVRAVTTQESELGSTKKSLVHRWVRVDEAQRAVA